ncbi:MAG: dihydroorotate dehydrogenase [Dehalococcoidia bacterium]
MPALAVEIRGEKRSLPLRNPVMVASGTFSNGLEYARVIDIERLGAIVSKGVTPRPRHGNETPRTVETAAGMLNSIGLQNIGVSALIKEVAPIWARWDVPVIVNIAGADPEEFALLAARLEGVDGVAALEINVSCPNVSHGLDYGQDPVMAAEVVAAVSSASTLPLIVKLTPNVTDASEVAEAVAAAGASALTVANTFLGMAIDVQRRRPVLPGVFGGLSGPAIKPLALRFVYEVSQAVEIPVIGCGGIMSGLDAVEYLMAGATAVQVGTATFQDPQRPLQVLDELTAFLEGEGVKDVAEIIGAAQVGRPGAGLPAARPVAEALS